MKNLLSKEELKNFAFMQGEIDSLLEKDLEYSFKTMPYFQDFLMRKEQAAEINSFREFKPFQWYAVLTLLGDNVNQEDEKGGILLKAEHLTEEGEVLEVVFSIKAFSFYDEEAKKNGLTFRILEGSKDDKGKETERAIKKGEKFVLMYYGLKQLTDRKTGKSKKGQFYHDFSIVRQEA